MRRPGWAARGGLATVILVWASLAGADESPAGQERPAADAPQASTRTGWMLTFRDEFGGRSVDGSKWASGFGWGPRSEGTSAFCDPANNAVGGGVLIQRIERRRQGGRPFSVGCLNSRDRFAQLYGYWEARIQFPGCDGGRGAVWAKPNDESWPPGLNVAQVDGIQPSVAKLTNHWREGRSAERGGGGYEGSDFSADYHVFGAEWTPTETIWYVDGVERRRTSAGASAMDDAGGFYTLVNTDVVAESSTCGEPAASSWQYVDYIRVWAHPSVPPDETAAGCRLPTRLSTTKPGLPRNTKETSGMAASERYPGVGWLIRDSGHPPSLYAFRVDGKGVSRVREIPVPAAENRDWEDLVYTRGLDGRGRLWVVESGQADDDRFLYEIAEPDPDRSTSAVVLGRYRYAFPDLGYANTEAAFALGGRLVLVTKTTPGRVYRFDKRLVPGVVNRPIFQGELRGADRVSVVRPSPDRRFLVAASHETVKIYRAPDSESSLAELIKNRPAAVRRLRAGETVEAGDWSPTRDCRFLLLSEHRALVRLDFTPRP